MSNRPAYYDTQGPVPERKRRDAVDYTGKIMRSDHWHRDQPFKIVSRNSEENPGIRFFTNDGIGSGVALTECEYTDGILHPGASAMDCIPAKFYERMKTGFLVIDVSSRLISKESGSSSNLQWPGYKHLKFKHKLSFIQPNGAPYTVAHMASQVAYIWRKFYQVRLYSRAWRL